MPPELNRLIEHIKRHLQTDPLKGFSVGSEELNLCYSTRLSLLKLDPQKDSSSAIPDSKRSVVLIENQAIEPELYTMRQNVLFAIRTMVRVTNDLKAKRKQTGREQVSRNHFLELQDVLNTRDKFHAHLLALISRSPDATRKLMGGLLIELIDTSLTIEYASMCYMVITNEAIKIKARKRDALCRVIANAAQTCYAISVELGITERGKFEDTLEGNKVANECLEEHQFLAELGLEDLLNS